MWLTDNCLINTNDNKGHMYSVIKMILFILNWLNVANSPKVQSPANTDVKENKINSYLFYP